MRELVHFPQKGMHADTFHALQIGEWLAAQQVFTDILVSSLPLVSEVS